MREEDLRTEVRLRIDRRLSALEEDPFLARRILALEKGKEKRMKKRITISFVAVLAIMVLTLGAAFAWSQSKIAEKLFGDVEYAPQEVMEQIQTPETQKTSPLCAVSVDEVLYDGYTLHASVTIQNPTEETLLYTIDGLWLDGQRLYNSALLSEGAGTAGMLLGGTVDGAVMPESYTFYNGSNTVYLQHADGTFAGYGPVPSGEGRLKVEVAVWRPINQPRLMDYKQYEGFDTSDTTNALVTDRTGFSDLGLLRPRDAYRNVTVFERSSAHYADVFQKLGWAEYVETIDMEVMVDMNGAAVMHAVPAESEIWHNGCRLKVDHFSLTHAGGVVDGWIYGDYHTVRQMIRHGLQLVDKENDRIIGTACFYDDQHENDTGLHFELQLDPVTGDLPREVYLAPVQNYDSRWDESNPEYDASVEKPDNVIGMWQYDFDRAFVLYLEVQ